MNSYSTDDHTATPAQPSADGRFASQPLEADPEALLAHTLNCSHHSTSSGWVLQDAIRFDSDTNLQQMV
jgi:hypothetical protein